MGCGAAEAGGSVVARWARQATQKSQSVPLLFHQDLDRWEQERCHLVVAWCEGRRGNLCVFKYPGKLLSCT